MDVLQEAVLEWIQGERIPQSRQQVIAELRTIASHCSEWPHATVSEWSRAIDATCKQGLLVESDGVLKLITVAATELEPTEAKQLELF
jgi:hypothetical protein